MSQNLRTYLTALFGFDATVRRTPDDRWDAASPCEQWTSADVLAHNIGMNDMIAGFTRGQDASGASHERPDDPAAAWNTSFQRLQAALDTQGALQTVARTPWGEMPVDKFLGFAWVDPVIHTWDLAKATGQEPIVDGELVERGLRQLERAGDSLRGPGRFDAAVEVDDGRSTLDRLVAISGRDPSWG